MNHIWVQDNSPKGEGDTVHNLGTVKNNCVSDI